ncbi:MAG: hypothetical protein JW737_03155 [Acidobacteria bacterium]|nr:hypothetical protein [Acidobacteriota bacterium]
MTIFGLDFKTEKFLLTSGFLSALAFVCMFFIMIFMGFSGWQVLWLLLTVGGVGVVYLFSTNTLTKYLAGLGFLVITLGGSFIHLLLDSFGFHFLMVIFLFITIVGLFGYFNIEQDPTIKNITAGAAGLYVLCHLLPLAPGTALPLAEIFKMPFLLLLANLALFICAAGVAAFIGLDLLKAQLPVELDFVLKLALYIMVGALVLQFLAGVFTSHTLKSFMFVLFYTIFTWSIGIIAGLSFYVMKEAQEAKTLPVNFKL